MSRLLHSQKQRHFCQPQCAALADEKIMKLSSLKEISRREAGSYIITNFIGGDGDLRSALFKLLRELPVGAEVSAIEVGPAECFHEVRAVPSGLELKRGCHGAHGTWRSCSDEEAVEWLLPGLEAVTKNPRLGTCSVTEAVHG